jgi:DNA-binding MarR family transcriptional regulator
MKHQNPKRKTPAAPNSRHQRDNGARQHPCHKQCTATAVECQITPAPPGKGITASRAPAHSGSIDVVDHLSLQQWRQRYAAVGLASIPLRPNSKVPLCESWTTKSPEEQWKEAGSAFRGNIGVRCDGVHIVLDADDIGTAEAVRSHLRGLGIAPPEVRSPHGYHFYLKVADAPPQFAVCNLPTAMGKGELRVRDCHVVAPCSCVDSCSYDFVVGGPETLLHLPAIAWHDLVIFVPSNGTQGHSENLSGPPVPLLRREMNEDMQQLLARLVSAPKGAPVEGANRVYPTRSEAEAGVVAGLILFGHSFEDIRCVFEHWKPGHYWEAGPYREEYLRRTYTNVLNELCNTPKRVEIADMYWAAAHMPWPGRAGILNRRVYLALLSICWQFADCTVHASQRDLAELAATRQSSVSRVLRRLEGEGWIDKIEDATEDRGIRWCVREFPRDCKCIISQPAADTAIAVTYDAGRIDTWHPEVFNPTLLGRTAGQVYACLHEYGSSTVRELIERTGRCKQAVKRALTRLEGHGLVIQDQNTPPRYILSQKPISQVAQELEAPKRARSRKERHTIQREAYREMVARARHRHTQGSST